MRALYALNTRKSTLGSQTMKSHVLKESKCYYESDEGMMESGGWGPCESQIIIVSLVKAANSPTVTIWVE